MLKALPALLKRLFHQQSNYNQSSAVADTMQSNPAAADLYKQLTDMIHEYRGQDIEGDTVLAPIGNNMPIMERCLTKIRAAFGTHPPAAFSWE